MGGTPEKENISLRRVLKIMNVHGNGCLGELTVRGLMKGQIQVHQTRVLAIKLAPFHLGQKKATIDADFPDFQIAEARARLRLTDIHIFERLGGENASFGRHCS
jgi:hypothetical protein